MGSTVASVKTSSDAPVVEEIFDLLYELVGHMRRYFDETAARFDLPPASAKALLRLDEPIPMNSLATALQCDRSNVTGLIDSLETRGLVERQVSDRDRRVKHVVVTPRGARVRRQLHKRLFENTPVLRGLSQTEQRTLYTLLSKGMRDT
jgi:DNA-binding MarR family transcriptional regulator